MKTKTHSNVVLCFCLQKLLDTYTNNVCTQVTGHGRMIALPPNLSVQITLVCDCRIEHCNVYSHLTAVVGGKRFTADESLCKGKRCGSVVTRVMGGQSVYGLVKKFVRVLCNCMRRWDFGFITWFPHPVYPDSDPLTVVIEMGDMDVNNLDRVCVTSLNSLQPARVSVLIDSANNSMKMMRIDGLDTMPVL